jgi:hypothetical protein
MRKEAMKLQMKSGSEGPRHDPYGYTEYIVTYDVQGYPGE